MGGVEVHLPVVKAEPVDELEVKVEAARKRRKKSGPVKRFGQTIVVMREEEEDRQASTVVSQGSAVAADGGHVSGEGVSLIVPQRSPACATMKASKGAARSVVVKEEPIERGEGEGDVERRGSREGDVEEVKEEVEEREAQPGDVVWCRVRLGRPSVAERRFSIGAEA